MVHFEMFNVSKSYVHDSYDFSRQSNEMFFLVYGHVIITLDTSNYSMLINVSVFDYTNDDEMTKTKKKSLKFIQSNFYFYGMISIVSH